MRIRCRTRQLGQYEIVNGRAHGLMDDYFAAADPAVRANLLGHLAYAYGQLAELSPGQQLMDLAAYPEQGSSWPQVFGDLARVAWALAASEWALACHGDPRRLWRQPPDPRPLAQVPGCEHQEVAAAWSQFWMLTDRADRGPVLTGQLHDLTATFAGEIVAGLLAEAGQNEMWLAAAGRVQMEGAQQ